MRFFTKSPRFQVVVEHLDGTVERDGERYPSLEAALPKGWEAYELGDALYCEPTVVNQVRIAAAARRAEKRSKPGRQARVEFIPAVLRYPLELVAYDPRHCRVVDRDETDEAFTGATPVGCYGRRVVVDA